MEQTTQLSNLSDVGDVQSCYIGDPWPWTQQPTLLTPKITVSTFALPPEKKVTEFTTTELIAELKRRKFESKELEGITFA